MQKKRLGRSDIEVTRICLGTMTWGSQNSAEEGWAQIDQALEAGVNFIDTAEMYPTTPRVEETFGRTEEIIGGWIERSGRRGDVVLATKIVGAGHPWPREGAPISGATMREALDASLKRLKTDYVDLYQMHWPNRGSYHFRQNWRFDARRLRGDRAAIRAEMAEILETADALVKEGKIRTLGLSNDTAWGTMQWLDVAEANGGPRVVSVQNDYSLLCRHFDLDMAELSHFEDVGLLGYSPLGAGILSGKYLGGAVPEGSRASIYPSLYGRANEISAEAVRGYVDIAKKHGLDPSAMAIAWTLTRPFMTSSIIGATSPEQLAICLSADALTLSDDVMADIGEAHKRWPAPI